MQDKKNNVRPELVAAILNVCEKNTDVVLVSLATTDGFPIKSFASKTLNVEADKIAAMSSTISSLSDSSSKQILDAQFDIAIVETKRGNMLFVRTQYLDRECVLTVVARAAMPLASARYHTNRLAEKISGITP